MTELQAADVPSPNVWKRIENLIRAEPRAAAVPVAGAGCWTACAAPWACGAAPRWLAAWPPWRPWWWA
jgi:hypothetical protein